MCAGPGGIYTNSAQNTSKMPRGYSTEGLSQSGGEIYGLSDEYGERKSTYESNIAREKANSPHNVTWQRYQFMDKGGTGNRVERSDSLKIQKRDRIQRAHADSRNIPYELWSRGDILSPTMGLGPRNLKQKSVDTPPSDIVLDKSGKFYTSPNRGQQGTSSAFGSTQKRKGTLTTAWVPSNYRTLGPTGVPMRQGKKGLRIGHEGVWTPPPASSGGSTGVNL